MLTFVENLFEKVGERFASLARRSGGACGGLLAYVGMRKTRETSLSEFESNGRSNRVGKQLRRRNRPCGPSVVVGTGMEPLYLGITSDGAGYRL